MTVYSFVDESGETRLRGTIDPAPGSAQTGNGPPVGVTTPSGIGALYIDTTHGALYIAHGTTNADWTAVGGNEPGNTGNAVGVMRDAQALALLAGVDRDTPLNGRGVQLSDAYADWNGGNAGLTVVGNGTDGEQTLVWSNAAGTFSLITTAGTLTGGPGGITFPSSDPHVNGAWWDNMGVLTKSSG